jgi:hypothetical protein
MLKTPPSLFYESQVRNDTPSEALRNPQQGCRLHTMDYAIVLHYGRCIPIKILYRLEPMVWD